MPHTGISLRTTENKTDDWQGSNLAIKPASQFLQVWQLTGLIALISPQLTNGTFGRLGKTKWKVNLYLAFWHCLDTIINSLKLFIVEPGMIWWHFNKFWDYKLRWWEGWLLSGAGASYQLSLQGQSSQLNHSQPASTTSSRSNGCVAGCRARQEASADSLILL